MSGGRDNKVVVYSYKTGMVKNIFKLGIGRIFCLLNLGGGIVCAQGDDLLKFIDGDNSNVIKTTDIKPDCRTVLVMRKVVDASCCITIYIGGSKSDKLSKLELSEISKKIGNV